MSDERLPDASVEIRRGLGLRAGQTVPAQVDQVRGHHLLRRFTHVEPPLRSHRHHPHQRLRVHRSECGIEATPIELAGQDVLDLADRIVEQTGEPAGTGALTTHQDAEPVGAFLQVSNANATD